MQKPQQDIIKKIETTTGITPYYVTEGCLLYHADCLPILKIFPDRYFHLLLADPPYGTAVMSRKLQKKKAPKSLVNAFQFGKYTWDKVPPKRYFTEMMRVSRNQVIFGYQYFEHLNKARCVICWDKQNDFNNFGDFELAYTSFKKANKIYRYLWNGMVQENQNPQKKEKRIHPNHKPKGLFMGILNDFAKKGQLIIDPYAGSCSTAAACLELGLLCVCIEREKEYCQRAKERLAATATQRRLFIS